MPRAELHRPELDGLRAVAFLAVYVLHALADTPALPEGKAGAGTAWWWWTSALLAGAFGVDLFFVLSSFLITGLLLREIDARGRLDIPAFWMRRILRIWPLYYAFLLTAAVVEGLPGKFVLAFAAFAGNWALLNIPMTTPTVTAPLWSVSVEEQFYLAWPLLLAAVPRRALPWLCAGMLAGSVTTRALLLAGDRGMDQIWLNTLTRLDPIALGALIALRWPSGSPAVPAAWRKPIAAAAVLAAVAVMGALWHGALVPGSPPAFPLAIKPGALPFAVGTLAYLAIDVACAVLLVLALDARGGALAHPAMVYLGRISYGLYVFHMASLHVLGAVWWPVRAVLALALTLGAAAVSYRWLEQPFLAMKERFTYVRSAPVAAVSDRVAQG